jgi:polyhydroxyalkanoate synthase
LKNLAVFTTPVNAEGMTLMRQWTDRRYFDVDRIVDTLGNVPPELMYASFDMLRPVSQMAGRLRLWDNMWNDEFTKSFRVFDRWATDQIPFPGECFRQFTKDFMWDNKFRANELELGGRKVNLGDIKVPFIHVMAEHDHIVPTSRQRSWSRSWERGQAGADSQGRARQPCRRGNAIYRLWPQLDQWLSERSV